MLTVAVACNNRTECYYGEDERWFCSEVNLLTECLSLGFLSILVFAVLLKQVRNHLRKDKFKDESLELEEEPERVPKNEEYWRRKLLDGDLLEKYHSDNPDFKQEMIISLLNVIFTLEKETRIQLLSEYYDKEKKFHNDNDAETKICLKSNFYSIITKNIIEDKFPGCTRRHCSLVEQFDLWLERHRLTWWLRHKVKRIFFIYLDIFKDIFLLVSIFFAIGGLKSLTDFPFKMTSVVVYSLAFSICIPLLMSSVILAKDRVNLGKHLTAREIAKIYLKTLCFPIINPIIILNSYETSIDTVKKCILREKNLDQIQNMLRHQQELKRQYVTFLATEIGLETVFQMVLQLVMLLLTETETPTSGGLESMFRREDTSVLGLFSVESSAILTISICWSLKSFIIYHLRAVKVDKQFFPTRCLLVLLAWTTVAACKRVMVLVAFFAPSFGLFSLLHHWRAEQIPFAVRQTRPVIPSDVLHLYNTTPVLWSDLDRWDWAEEPPAPPSYALYTGLSTGEYFILFWLLVTLHTASLYILKLLTSPAFRRNNSLIERLVHALRAINLPSVFEDWDGPHGTVEDYRRRHCQVNIEMVSTMIVNLTFNLSMLLPLLFTG